MPSIFTTKSSNVKLKMSGSEDVNFGEGWYEFTQAGVLTTHIAYVNESGLIYTPEHDVNEWDFRLASAQGRAFKLIRAQDAV